MAQEVDHTVFMPCYPTCSCIGSCAPRGACIVGKELFLGLSKSIEQFSSQFTTYLICTTQHCVFVDAVEVQMCIYTLTYQLVSRRKVVKIMLDFGNLWLT